MTSVAKEVAAKLKLEDSLKPKLRKFFKQIGQDVKTVWSSTQTIPNLNSFELELTAILRNHYRNVSKPFVKFAFDSIRPSINTSRRKQYELMPGGSDSSYTANPEEDTAKDKLAALLLLLAIAINKYENDIISFINNYSVQQSRFILSTTESQLRTISMKAIVDNNVAGTSATPAEIGSQIQNEFAASSDNRVDTITTTETQAAAETSKLLVALALAALVSGEGVSENGFPAGTLIKTWHAVIDTKTRAAHLAANGQIVRVDTPFLVGGERLPAPGQGGSVGNIANCRCVATYSVAGE